MDVDPATPSRSGLQRVVRWVVPLLVVVVIAVTAGSSTVRAGIPRFVEGLRDAGPMGMALFVGAYVGACLLFLPGSVLTLGAGAVFGVVRGFALVSVASTLGATLSFLLGRFLARDWIAARAASNPRFAAIDGAVGREGWRMVALLRLSPLFPFNLLNYSLGLTRVGLRDYVLASWIGMMPGTLLFVWLGAAAGDVAGAASGQRPRQPAEWVFLAAGLLATVWVSLRITRLARAALQRRLEPGAGDGESRR